MSLFGDYDELSEEFLFGPREPPHARWQNNTFEKDLSQFNVVQWMEHFWNDDDDHEFNDDEIPNKYQNVCGKVKSWIREDLVQAAMHQVELNDPTPTDLVLLLTLIRSHLNLDLIFYMIEFIPTWSKWKKVKAEAIHQRIIQLPSGIVKRHAKFESYWDLPFVTFHKMRLLCKSFNVRMMKKILESNSLVLGCENRTICTTAIGFYSMLQQLYRENKISLSMNSVFFTELNERLRHLDEDPSKVFKVTGSLKKSLLFDDHIDDNDNDNDFFSSPSHKSSQVCVKDELTQKYGFSNPSIELFSHETKKLSLKHEIVTCSSQFLLISNGDGSKQDPWGSSYESELRGFDKLDKRVAMKIVDNMSVASNRILNYKKKPSVNHDNPIKSLWSFIWNLAIEDLENAKRFLKYLCLDLNFPIECIEFEDEMGKSVLGQCLLQYLVFLCNEFQDGRLFNMSHDTTMQRRMDALPLLILSNGWDFQKQEKELPFIFKSNTKHSQQLLPYLLFQSQRYKHVDENYVFSLLLQKMLVSGWTDLDLILSYYLIENEEMIIHLFTTSDRRVQYSSTMTLPLFVSVLLSCNVNQKFVPKRLMEKMSAEQFHTMIGTHLDSNGDSILHLYLKSVGDDHYALLDGELVLSLIRKAPNLLLTRNNDGLTPKQMLLESCSPMSYYLVYLIKTEFAQYL